MKKYNNFVKHVHESYLSVEYTKSIPTIIKDIINQIKEKININTKNIFFDFTKNENFPISFHLNINFTKSDQSVYDSDINIIDVVQNQFENFNINMNIKDSSLDINKLLSSLHHELRHVYDILVLSDDLDTKSFFDIEKNNKFKIKYPQFKYFFNLIYLSLEHELVARNSMLYHKLIYLNINDKEKLLDEIKKTFSYKYLLELKKFDATQFINTFNINDLFIMTNDYLYEQNLKINSVEELVSYYQKWSDFFKIKSDEYMSYFDDVIDEVIKDINNNNVKENFYFKKYKTNICYNENIFNSYLFEFKQINQKFLE